MKHVHPNINSEQRMKNLIGARKKYSDFSKNNCKHGKEEEIMKQRIEENKKEMAEVKEELAKCRKEYRNLIKTIGKAHQEAMLHENEETIIDELIQKRENKVRSRAELVLLEEVHRLRLLELKKQLEKEKLLKKRRDIFRLKSPAPKVRPKEKETQEKLKEWKKFENLVKQEIDELKRDKENSKNRTIMEVKESQNSFKPKGEKPVIKVLVRGNGKKNAQVQTDTLLQSFHKHHSSSDGDFSNPDQVSKAITKPISLKNLNHAAKKTQNVISEPISTKVSKPFREINNSLENLIAIKIKEKLEKQQVNEKKKEATKAVRDFATNTSLIENVSISQFSETSYLCLPVNETLEDKKSNNNNEKSIGNNDKTTTSELYDMSQIDLKELIQKIQSIRTLVTDQRKELPAEDSFDSFDDKLFTNDLNAKQKDQIETNDQNKQVAIHGQNVEKVDALSDLDLSSSSSSRETIKRINNQADNIISNISLSLSSLSDDSSLSIENGRYNDDSSLSSLSEARSFQTSFDFSNFSRRLSVDKEKFWQDVLDLACVHRKNFSLPQLSVRKSRSHFLQSTPKTNRYLENIL